MSRQILLWLFVAAWLYVGIRYMQVGWSKRRCRAYWRQRNTETPGEKDFRLVVLGDSVAQGVGSSVPSKSLAGLIRLHIKQRLKRKVFVNNFSVSGATVNGVVSRQVPKADLKKADLIILVASANDAFKNIPPETYEQGLEHLLKELPANKTLIADFPWVRHRSRYVPILHALTAKYGFTLVSFDIATPKSRLPLLYVAGDFLHPSDRGYKDIWFHSFKPHIDTYLDRLKTGAK